MEAQRVIVGNPLRSKRFVYQYNDPIAFAVNSNRNIICGQIQQIKPKSLVVQNQAYSYKNIRKIIMPNKLIFLRKTGLTLIGSSLIGFTISGFARMSDGKSFTDKDQLIVLGILSGVGITLTPFKDRHYRIGRSRRIRYTKL